MFLFFLNSFLFFSFLFFLKFCLILSFLYYCLNVFPLFGVRLYHTGCDCQQSARRYCFFFHKKPFPGKMRLRAHSSVSSHFFFLGTSFLSCTWPGFATGIRFRLLILCFSFFDSFANSLASAFVSFLMSPPLMAYGWQALWNCLYFDLKLQF